MTFVAKLSLYALLGWLLAVAGINVIDNIWLFLGILTNVIFIEALAYIEGRRGS